MPFRRQDAGLNHPFLADYLEIQSESQALGELAHKLALRSAISFPEGMNAIYLGDQCGRWRGALLRGSKKGTS
jgi:hypothetical protein